MKTSKLFFLGGIFLFSIFSCCKEHTDPPPVNPESKALTDSLTLLHDNSLLTGFAVTVVKNDQVAYQNSFGFANVADEVKYSNETTQPIASVSKTFIAASLMKAIEQGHFTLEANINDILPFQVINPNFPDKTIQIKHLVTHTSSLIDEGESYNIDSYFYLPGEFEKLTLGMQGLIAEYGTQEGELMPLGDYLKAYYTPDGSLYDEDNFSEWAPGEENEYSNIAASLAAYLIEVKAGMLFRDYVKKHIFDPLKMNDSAFRYSDLVACKAATLYLTKNDFYPIYGNHSYPDGSVNASNRDMGNFLVEMIKGSNGQGTILSKESYKMLFERNELSDVDEDISHSVFWDLNEGRIAHSGGDPGVITFLSFDQIAQTGYYFMTNIDADSDDGDEIFEKIIEVVSFLKDFEKI